MAADGKMSPAAEEDEERSRPVKRVAVVGAGVSGLSAAYKLKTHGLDVTVFESEGQAGGKLKSFCQNGLIWDEGANTMTESEEVRYLLDNVVGLRKNQQFPIANKKRYIVRDGVPVLLPTNPIALIKTNFLSAQTKFQLIFEPFLWKKKKRGADDESVGSFFQRHFGKEIVDYIIDPFVAGTSAGDPESISARHGFPELWDLEKRYGSVIMGAIRSKLSTGKKDGTKGSFSFFGGMQTLVDALYKEIGEDGFKFQSKVLELSYGSNNTDHWSISYAPTHNLFEPIANLHPFDAVIMTAPLGNVKQMKITKRENPFHLTFIPNVSYLPLSVIITTFKKINVSRRLEGFGVLIPSKEQKNGLKTLGTLFSSSMFPDRAPNDEYMYTTFVGGSRNMELAKASRDELKQVVTADLRQLLGAEGDPCFVSHCYWREAFPLYGKDYDSVIAGIQKMEEGLPGFFYAGNHKEGLSVAKAISSGIKTADLVISYLDYASHNIKKDMSDQPEK